MMTMTTSRITAFVASVLLSFVLGGCGGSDGDGPTTAEAADSGTDNRPTVAYVTNGIASFWYIAEAGAKAAGRDYDAQVIVRMPPGGIVDQTRMIEELIAMKIDGMAVSPIDGENQNDILNMAAGHMPVITHDSDAPDSDRLCYVGMDNYTAGRICGQLVREAMPVGGEVMIFIGRLEQDNGRLRRQGLIDELLDRAPDRTRYDKPGGLLRGRKYTILDTRTDDFTQAGSQAQVEDALARYPGIDGMIGLFAYNTPAILNALQKAGKLGEVVVVGFDEQQETLDAIRSGTCYGTIVQNPYLYGYESVRILAQTARGSQAAVPASGFFDIPARRITKENVDQFEADLKAKLSAAQRKGG